MATKGEMVRALAEYFDLNPNKVDAMTRAMARAGLRSPGGARAGGGAHDRRRYLSPDLGIGHECRNQRCGGICMSYSPIVGQDLA